MDEQFFLYNGLLYHSGTPFLNEKSPAVKYGDGLFETIRVNKGRIINSRLHFARFFRGLSLLKFSVSETFSESFLTQKINLLLKENNLPGHARVRLTAFRPVNGRSGAPPDYLIEATQAGEPAVLNSRGLVVDVFDDARKACDLFANIKSNNYLSNTMAMLYAQERNLDECLLLNSFGRVCESTISNLFIIKDKEIFTPTLAEGCVEGVVRSWLIKNLPAHGIIINQKAITIEEALEADELFLTNSIRLIRWIEKFRHKKYANRYTREIGGLVLQHMIKES